MEINRPPLDGSTILEADAKPNETQNAETELEFEFGSELDFIESTAAAEISESSFEEPLVEDIFAELAADAPEFSDETSSLEPTAEPIDAAILDSELAGFESAAIEELEFVEDAKLGSVLESIFFATDRPVSMVSLKIVFKGTNVTGNKLKHFIEKLQIELAGGHRGVTLEEVGAGWQLRTKTDNIQFLQRALKAKPFRLSGPALEVLAIVAYKQPIVKSEIDQIRGVESGHLLRALMEKNLCCFEGKSDLPGKPMLYGTTRKFLEIFSLRNLRELPTLHQIDEIIPEGIGEEEQNKPKLQDITEGLSHSVGTQYSDGEEELGKISSQLEEIQTSSDFFEKEKERAKAKRDEERAQGIRDAIIVGEDVTNRDRNWLAKYEAELAGLGAESEITEEVSAEMPADALSDNLIETIDTEEESFLGDDFEANDLADIDGP